MMEQDSSQRTDPMARVFPKVQHPAPAPAPAPAPGKNRTIHYRLIHASEA